MTAPAHPPYLLTRSGTRIDLLAPRPEDVSLYDVAHALARICRYTGHVIPSHYSVARHSINVARALRGDGHARGIQAQGLMHDAHEAYTGDVASPIKRALAFLYDPTGPAGGGIDPWRAFERRHADAVRVRFGLPLTLAKPVQEADISALLTEARDLMPEDVGPDAGGWPPGRPWELRVRGYCAEIDALDFLAEAEIVGIA